MSRLPLATQRLVVEFTAAEGALIRMLGVVERREYSSSPPRFEYHLTESGRALSPVMSALRQWGDDHVTQGPPPVVFEHDCGAAFVPVMHCRACGQAAVRGSIHVRH